MSLHFRRPTEDTGVDIELGFLGGIARLEGREVASLLTY